MKTVDVAAVLDEGRFTGYQKLLIAGTALTVILDGVDNQVLPNTLAALARDFSLTPGAFKNVLAAGPFGMMIGGAIGGLIGDRLGRRTALLGSAVAFGIITYFIAHADTLLALGVLRFLAGIGLGGAMPNAAALASEYVPRRNRPFAVTLTIVCIPLGGTLAGYVVGQLLPTWGWRPLFQLAGIVPLVLAAVLFKILPESPRFMARHPERWPELRRLMRRLGHDVDDDTTFVDASGDVRQAQSKGKASDLFAPGLIRDTLALCGAFFFCLIAIYVGFIVLPTALTSTGMTPSQGSYGNSMLNAGGVVGAIGGAFLIQRLGSRLTLLGISGLSVIFSVAMAFMQIGPATIVSTMVMLAITGGLINAVQTTMYALAAHVYPTEIRSTGVGVTVAFGRVGNVLASYVGFGALSIGGSAAYFGSWAICMALVFVALAIVRRHIPGSKQEGTVAYAAH